MARPPKDGFDYFPVDVDWDEKLQGLEMVFRNDATKWILEFWKTAYRTNAGTVGFNTPTTELLHASKCYITLDRHREILEVAVQIDFCHETFPGSQIYTSSGIQKRIGWVLKERKEAKERKNEMKGKETPHCSANNPIVRRTTPDSAEQQTKNGNIDRYREDYYQEVAPIIKAAKDSLMKKNTMVGRISEILESIE